MELRQLYYFKAVAETESMTEAAKKLHIPQPTLSKVIRRLEDDLGVRLFDRHAASLSLNPFGGSFLVYVNQALDALERGRACMDNMRSGETHAIRLISTFQGFSTMLVESFSRLHPNVSIIERTEHPENVRSIMLNGHMDFAVTMFPLQAPQLKQAFMLHEPLLLLVPPSMKFPTGKIKLKDFESARFGIFEGGKDLNDAFLRCANEAGFVPNIVYRTSRSEIFFQLVEDLDLCTLVPAHLLLHIWDTIPEQIRLRIRLVDEPKCFRNVYLYLTEKSTLGNPDAELFLTHAVSFFKKDRLGDYRKSLLMESRRCFARTLKVE